MHSFTQAPSRRGRSSSRATLAVVLGLPAALVVPVAIEVTRRMSGSPLLDAAWAIPVAAVLAVAAFLLGRGARGTRLFMTGRILAVTGMCFVLSSSLAVGIYEFLLWKEHSS